MHSSSVHSCKNMMQDSNLSSNMIHNEIHRKQRITINHTLITANNASSCLMDDDIKPTVHADKTSREQKYCCGNIKALANFATSAPIVRLVFAHFKYLQLKRKYCRMGLTYKFSNKCHPWESCNCDRYLKSPVPLFSAGMHLLERDILTQEHLARVTSISLVSIQ
jgi:hypothetical protein